MADLTIRLVGRGADVEDDRQRLRRADYRTDTLGLGVGMIPFLRGRLRRRWLRLRRED